MIKASIMQKAWLVSCALCASWAMAADITAVDVNQVTPEKQIIKLTFNGTPPTPTSFSVTKPARIAFDFPGAGNQAGKSSVQVNGSALTVLNIAEGSGRTRLVLNLQKPAGYTAKVEGNTYLITLDGAQANTPAETRPVHFADAKPAAAAQSIKGVDFRRGPNGEGRLVVDLSDPNVGIDIRPQGKSLLVDFAKAALPKSLERRMDVTDFGTPVVKVDAYSLGENTRLAIEPKGNWEYSAYQTENRFIVEVRPKVEDNKISAIKPAYKGEKLSLNFQNVEIRTVLQVIAEFTGLNIITSDSVNGSLTLRLKDVPWDQALDIILQAKGLDQRKSGNVLWIAPRAELADKEKQQFEAQKNVDDLEPTRTESFELKYQKGDDIKKMLSDDKQQMLSKRGSIVVDPRTNTLFIQDVSSKLEQIRAVINKIDVPVRQVMIEARIVEASDTFSRELGARLGWASLSHVGNTTVGTSPSLSNYSGTGSNTGNSSANTLSASNLLGVNLPATGLGVGNASTFALVAQSANWLLGLELSALEADSKGKIISSPRLVTADQVEAVIEDGQQIPYSQSAQNGATTIAFKDATLSLRVTPQITPDGNVVLDVKVNKDSVGQTTSNGPAINTKHIETKVLVENGGTVVIGGIYTQTLTNSVDKTPLLGDIPVLGNLFKYHIDTDNRAELLIFITPKIIQSDLTLR
ncbi:type IV pilus secretin PilQ [Amantichitinum ursilacus]|uniref:Type IV pilus biogenesis and competence protein PilQ n=1 Tax=Amantichitinum ursilacus TaxID=857265 RepID=A0A0N0XM78_9NEIS|nr:type IV pilus secretin PilQ [Amantichitinum ursilacus]KPC53948.1 Type IV pilus biogenesis and competence protein PilQ precursor [Amantichitinum ursilacus]